MISSLSSTTVKVCKDYHVADQASHDAKPCCRFARLAPADRTLSLDHISAVVSHDVLLLRPNASSAPDAEDQALTFVKQPPFPTAVGVNFSSSSDGLGIHEPGSNTRGDRSAMTAPSGRALESANCPAVARFSPRPGSHAAVSTFHQPGVTETAATNSDLACASSETAATAIPGPVCAVAALLNLDALVDIRAKNVICATSSSS